MKNKQFAIGLTLGIAVMMCIAAAEYDLQKGVDLSTKTSVTASQLNQLVDNGTVAANKGMLIYSATTPDTTNNTRYSRFIWLDTSSSPPVPKVYYTNGSYWTNITANTTIADNSVTAGKLAANSVYETNLTASSVTASKIADGVIGSSKYANASISNTHIASLTIQSTNIANGQILSTNIGAAAILGYHLASGQISTANLTNGFLLQGTNIANGTIGSNHIANAGLSITNLPTNSITSSYIASGTLPSKFTSSSIALPSAGATTTTAHGLAGRPQSVQVYLRCISNDGASAYVTGDEINITAACQSGTYYPEFNFDVDATNVKVRRSSVGGAFSILKKDTGVQIAVTSAANFEFKIYAVYIP